MAPAYVKEAPSKGSIGSQAMCLLARRFRDPTDPTNRRNDAPKDWVRRVLDEPLEVETALA